MIINKLTLTAFGPYKEREEIDFQPLNEAKLFAICGSTGAGKTAIFDAVSYAIYGKASGISRKEPETLRCIMAEDNTFTEVMLEFTMKQQRYRVRRQMPHVKEGNKNPSGGRVELHRWDRKANEGDGAWVDLLDTGKTGEMNEKLTSIIGLDADQFRQIVMLPQGEFEKLLLAESEEKEKILRQIFNTHRYMELTVKLKNRASNLQKEYNQCQQNVKALEGVLQNTMEVIPEAAVSEVLGQDAHNPGQLTAALVKDLSTLDQKAEALKDSLQGEKERQTLLHATWLQAEQDNQSLKKLMETREKMSAIKAAEKDMLKLKGQLEEAVKANRIKPLYEQLNSVAKGLVEKEKELAQASLKHEKAKEVHQLAEEQWKAAQAIKPELVEKQALMHQLKGYLPQVKELASAKENLESAKKGLLKLQTQKTALEKWEKETEQKHQSLSEEEELLHRSLEVTTNLYEIKEKLTKQQHFLDTVHGLSSKIEEQKRTATASQKLFVEKKKAFQHLEKEWVDGQAALLAATLQEGEPCPVCGSHEHPVKASGVEAPPSREGLEEARNQLDKASQANTEAVTQLKNLQEQRQNQVNELKVFIGEEGQVDLPTIERNVTKGFKMVRQVFEDLENKKKRQEAVKQELKTLLGQMKEIKASLEEAAKQEKELLNLQSGNEKVIGLVEGQVPVVYHSVTRLQEKLEELDHWTISQEKKLVQAQQALEEWQKQLIQCKAAHENALKNLEELKAEKGRLAQSWEKSRLATGFDSDEGFLEAVMPEEWVVQQERTIKEFLHNASVTETNLQELEKSLKGKELKNVEQLKKETEEQDARVEFLGKEFLQLKGLHKTASELLKQLEKGLNESTAAHEKWKKVYRLYTATSGNENQKKLTLETFVQQHYFGQILEHANNRLYDLTQGQYLLVPDEEREKGRKKSGLGIDVYDSYTDKTRSAKTLSGGEKFNASLCLALGMYDVIQSNSGGTEMNTMFIDEGFGSLDPQEALPKAVQMLVDMQEAGRVIGVISHVSEMREQLSALLEVEKGIDGSSSTRISLKN